jgi:hypothetical protein
LPYLHRALNLSKQNPSPFHTSLVSSLLPVPALCHEIWPDSLAVTSLRLRQALREIAQSTPGYHSNARLEIVLERGTKVQALCHEHWPDIVAIALLRARFFMKLLMQ